MDNALDDHESDLDSDSEIDSHSSSIDPHPCSEADSDNSEDEDVELDDCMFEPIYEDAKITVSGAYCAIMEFKRACRLPFTTVTMLLELLQLFCPQDNKLPRTVYTFRKFFKKYSSTVKRRQFCSVCNNEFRAGQDRCDNSSCCHNEPNTLITLNPKRAIRRVLQSKFTQSIAWLPA